MQGSFPACASCTDGAVPIPLSSSSLTRQRCSQPALGLGLVWCTQEEPKRARAKPFPAHFSALTHLQAFSGCSWVPSTLSCLSSLLPSASSTWGPGFPEYLAGSSTGQLHSAGSGSRLKVQAGLSAWPGAAPGPCTEPDLAAGSGSALRVGSP